MKLLISVFFSGVLFAQQTYTACASGCDYTSVQGAVTQAATYQDGTVCEPVFIIITAGETFTENVILPNKVCAQYVRLRSSRLDELPDGVRVVEADSPKMPKIIAPNNSINATIRTAQASGTGYWALEGLEISSPASQSGALYQFTLVGLPEDSTGEKQLSLTPHHITIDRSWLHGVTDVEGPQRCIGAHGRNIIVKNSRIENCKYNSGGDSQGIFIQNGPGPISVVNNYIEGGSENVLIGQGPGNSAIPWLSQRNLTFLGNYFYKRRSWKFSEASGVPTWTPCLDGEKYRNTSGGQWYICNANTWSTTANQSRVFVKNLFELKEGQNTRVEGNSFDGNWRDGQSGTNFLINQSDTVQLNVRGIKMVSNKWRYGQAAFGTGYFGTSTVTYTGDILLANNLFEDLGTDLYGYAGSNAGSSTFFYLAQRNQRNIFIQHNTVVRPLTGAYLNNITKSSDIQYNFPGPIDIRDNAIYPGQFLFNRDSYPNNGWCSWRAIMNQVGDFQFANNLITGPAGSYSTGDSPGCPSYVDFPTSVIFGTDYATTFTDYVARDWSMKSGGPGIASASDGTNVGVDFEVLDAATATAESGAWPDYLFGGFRSLISSSGVVSFNFSSPTTTSCTVSASTSKSFSVTAGSPSVTQTGRSGSGTITGLTLGNFYWVRLVCGSAKYYSSVVAR